MSNRQRRVSRADEREARTGMRQSMGVMIAKIAFGAVSIALGFDSGDPDWTGVHRATSIIVGLAFIAWGLLPYLNARRIRAERARQREMEQTEKILSVPLSEFGKEDLDDKAEILAKQYEKH